MRAEAAQIAAEGPRHPEESAQSAEPFCDQMGEVVKNIAEMRDKGVDEEIALSSFRTTIRALANQKVAASAQNAFSPLIAKLYAHPEMTPVEARAQWLLVCYEVYPTGTPPSAQGRRQ
jgi:hypothetical protein